MRRIGRVGAISVIALVLGAAAAWAAGSGLIWKVEGKKLEAGKTEQVTAKQSGIYQFKGKMFGSTSVTITCKHQTDSGDIIGGEPGAGEAKIEYRECSSQSCTPHEPIAAEVNSELVYFESEGKRFFGDLFTPKSAPVFSRITCSSTSVNIEGEEMAEMLNEKDERVEAGKETELKKGFVKFLGTSTQEYTNYKNEHGTAALTVEGNPATVEGTTEASLTSGKKVSP
jgi:hypothetical protein